MNKKFIFVGIPFAILLLMSAVAAVNMSAPKNINQADMAMEREKIINKLLSPITQNASALGNDEAKITIVEFGDYQCTYCHRFHQDTKDKIIENYVNTGKAKFLFKDLVINDLPKDKASSLAAEASYCAAEQGKYWQYHDEIYNNWEGENTGWITKESLKQFANNVKIPDLMKFSDCVEGQKYSNLVQENTIFANSIGLASTPNFILYNGTIPLNIPGAHPYEVFDQALKELSK
ncbi:MAG: disulfide bond formation protein DsbA [Nitrososphaeraceae archaeon]|nr:disulfide bond formation protein DsbA [Nitrososphaeraceae archaeon]